jgi:mRNA deadenylase 3'-5' endonuclease subunit Ccr4
MFIKVLSWNILASEFIKKTYYPTLNFNLLNDRNKRIKIIIDNLMKEDPDIILLQEVMVKEYNYLKKYLKKNYYF